MTPDKILELTEKQAEAFVFLLNKQYLEETRIAYTYDNGTSERSRYKYRASKVHELLYGMKLHAGVCDECIRTLTPSYGGMQSVHAARVAILASGGAEKE